MQRFDAYRFVYRYNSTYRKQIEPMVNPEVTEDIFRSAWSKFATGVAIISTVESDGESIHGMTANGVASVSLNPPLAMVTVAHERNTYPLIRDSGRFGLSILTFDQRGIARHFTVPFEIRKTLPPPPFEKLGASMVVAGALSAMDCRVVNSVRAGDHTVFIAEVEDVKIGYGHPLLYYQSRFEKLA